MKKSLLIALSALLLSCNLAHAKTAAEYITEGREQLFSHTISGVRQSHATFNEALAIGDFSTNAEYQEVHFWRAFTRLCMLLVRTEGANLDSAFKLAEEFGVSVIGDDFVEDEGGEMRLDIEMAEQGFYQVPDSAPGIYDLRQPFDDYCLPELEAILAELSLIQDQPGNPFLVLLHPDETEAPYNIEIDLGDVLVLRAIVRIAKVGVETRWAHDLYVDEDDPVIEEAVNRSFDINAFLQTYPNLLKLMPTSGHESENGRQVLIQLRQDIIACIDGAQAALDYIRNETDDQANDFLHLGIGYPEHADLVDEILQNMRDGITRDEVRDLTMSITKGYEITGPGVDPAGSLELDYDPLGMPEDGMLDIPGLNPWRLETMHTVGDEIIMEFLPDNYDYWGGAMLTGQVVPGQDRIVDIELEIWGDTSATYQGLVAQMTSEEIETEQFDINPLLGNSARYPDPVSPRDLLPEFNQWNYPQPGTISQGLINGGADPDFAATLGGALPNMTQDKWIEMANLQPSGDVYLQELAPFQIALDQQNFVNYAAFWTADQVIFVDPQGDIPDETQEHGVTGLDLASVCMGHAQAQNQMTLMNEEHLFITLTFYDTIAASATNCSYDIFLSPCPNKLEAIGSIHLAVQDGEVIIYEFQESEYEGERPYWSYRNNHQMHLGSNTLDLALPLSALGSTLPGKFITVTTNQSGDWPIPHLTADRNATHMRIVGWDDINAMGSIQGEVTFPSAPTPDTPIFVQAYGDPDDPEGSVIAATRLEGPGAFTLDGLGLGWQGYIRAWAPAYGFSVFDSGNNEIEDVQPIAVVHPITPPIAQTSDTGGLLDMSQFGLELDAHASDVQLELNVWHDLCGNAALITEGVPFNGNTAGATGEDLTEGFGCIDDQDLWHRFVPTQDGVYQITWDILSSWPGNMAVFDHCGGRMLTAGSNCIKPIYFNAVAGEDYLLRLGVDSSPGDYSLTVSLFEGPLAHDDCADATELTVGQLHHDSYRGATSSTEPYSGDRPRRDVWHRFTADQAGVYSISCTYSEPSAFQPYLFVTDICGSNNGQDNFTSCNDLRMAAEQGQSYLIQVFDLEYFINPSAYDITVSYLGAAEINDTCENALPITAGIDTSVSTVTATGDGFSWYSLCDMMGVWYRFSPTIDAIYTINIAGDQVGTAWNVIGYEGCEGNEFPLNDDPCSAAMLFHGHPGRECYFRAYEFYDVGTATLRIDLIGPAVHNDDVHDAALIMEGQTYNGTTVNATGWNETDRGCDDIFDVWHVFEPQRSGIYDIDLQSPNVNMKYSVFQKDWPDWPSDDLEEILWPCENNTRDNYLRGRAGQTYYIRVAARSQETGSYSLTINKRMNPLADMNGDDDVDFIDLGILVAQWLADNCAANGNCNNADLDRSGQVDLQDFHGLEHLWMK